MDIHVTTHRIDLPAPVFTRFFTTETPTIEAADALTLELRSFLDSVRTRTTPVVDGVAGLKAVELADAILEGDEASSVLQNLSVEDLELLFS